MHTDHPQKQAPATILPFAGAQRKIARNLSFRAEGSRNMLFGFFWMATGLGISAYISTTISQGANYLLPVLLCIFGLVQFFKGVIGYFSSPDQ